MTMTLHPDIVDILDYIERDVFGLGKDAGLRDAVEYVDKVRAELGDTRSDQWYRGFDEGRDAIAGERTISDDWHTRLRDTNDLNYDPAPVLEALKAVYDQGIVAGLTAAIEAARNQRDTETAPDREDYVSEPDEDEDEDEEEVENYQNQADYVDGLLHVAVCLVAQFPDQDPDPNWEPA